MQENTDQKNSIFEHFTWWVEKSFKMNFRIFQNASLFHEDWAFSCFTGSDNGEETNKPTLVTTDATTRAVL